MRDNIKRIKIQVTGWENIFAKDIADKELFSKIHKERFNFNNKKIKNQIKLHQYLKKYLIKEDIQMYIGVRKDAPHHTSSGKYKLRLQQDTVIHQIKMAKSRH